MNVRPRQRLASRRGPAWIVALLSAAAVLSACSSPTPPAVTQPSSQEVLTHDQYQQALQQILTSDGRTATQLFTDTVATEYDAQQCAPKVRDLHDRLESILRRVEDLQPPADAAERQREFLTAARESVRLVGVAAEDVEKGALSCGPRLNARIYGLPSTERAQAAITKLEESGYVVFGS